MGADLRLSELAEIRCHPRRPLLQRPGPAQPPDPRPRQKAKTAETVKISHQAARSLDRAC